MNEKLKNIFVPYEVAKLAFEKGFTEWCAGFQNSESAQLKNSKDLGIFEFDFEYFADDSKDEYGLPTHFQLIVWLKSKHDIDVTMQINGFWRIIDAHGNRVYFENETEFEINQALEVALNLLPDFIHDKQEYV